MNGYTFEASGTEITVSYKGEVVKKISFPCEVFGYGDCGWGVICREEDQINEM